MPTHRLIITEVTRYGDHFCVAGWDVDRAIMVRPEPSTANALVTASRFWDARYAGPGKLFQVGNFVTLENLSESPPNFQYPHRTEDRLQVRGAKAQIHNGYELRQVAEIVKGGVSASIRAVFDGGLQRSWTGTGSTTAFVPRGFVGRSLGAVEIAPDRMHFAEKTSNGKIQVRALIREGVTTFDFSVTSDEIKTVFQAGGLDAVRQLLVGCELVHVRLGLSRPFPQKPEECYAQVNGLYFFR